MTDEYPPGEALASVRRAKDQGYTSAIVSPSFEKAVRRDMALEEQNRLRRLFCRCGHSRNDHSYWGHHCWNESWDGEQHAACGCKGFVADPRRLQPVAGSR